MRWKPPPERAQNGVVIGYKLIMKKKGGPRLAKFSVDGARYNYTFKSEWSLIAMNVIRVDVSLCV